MKLGLPLHFHPLLEGRNKYSAMNGGLSTTGALPMDPSAECVAGASLSCELRASGT